LTLDCKFISQFSSSGHSADTEALSLTRPGSVLINTSKAVHILHLSLFTSLDNSTYKQDRHRWYWS